MEHLSQSISAHLEMSRGKFLKNGVAPEKGSGNDERKPKSSNIQRLRDMLIGPCLLKPGQSWREKLTFVAENAKDDKDAPTYLFGYLRGYIVFDKDSDAFYNWLMVVSLAVMYNFILVVMLCILRSVIIRLVI